MPSSERARVLGVSVVLAAASALTSRAEAQPTQAQGFAVERLYTSAPGGGWVVMDDLNLYGGLGGVAALTTGYSHDALRIPDGSQPLPVVSDQAFADFGFAATYDRFRLYVNFDMPLLVEGQSGTVGNYQFTAPTAASPSPDPTPHFVDITENPDTLSDARVGLDARILGAPGAPFRLGASAQLYIPSAERSEYLTDDTYRAMFRALFAGDIGPFTYAGQLGVHVRPLDDSPTPQSPEGSELLFGGAAGAKVPVGTGAMQVVVGPEVFGATAFKSLFGKETTALEGLLSGRLEGTGGDGAQLRVKLGVGLGINDAFGAPEWRAVIGVEVFDHSSDRDRDGVFDSRDACPDVRGVKTDDPKTNGCPAK
jgi:OOP family OmpA-OmpF porin